jgi:hypothetical protein
LIPLPPPDELLEPHAASPSATTPAANAAWITLLIDSIMASPVFVVAPRAN